MNISEPTRQIIANVDYFKSPTCSGFKYVAAQIALFFCKLFHFFKTGEWLNDPKLLEKVEQRIYTIKSGALRESFSDEEKDELTRVLNEMLIRVNQPPHKYVKPFAKIEKKDSKNTSTENEIKIDNKPSSTTKVAILELYPSEFIWSDDEEYNKTIFNRWGYDSEITLFDGTPISSILKHGDYLIYVEIIYREINGEINKVKTLLPSYLLLHDGPENEDCFFKLKKKDQILNIKYPKFEVLRQAEYSIYEQLSFGSRRGAFSSKPIEVIYSDTYENRFSSGEPQFPMPTTLHKKNLTARPLIELSANISLYEFLNIHKSIENRIDFCINFEGNKQELSKLNEVPNLTKYEKEAEFMFNPKSGFLISLPGSLKINISLFDDFMYVFSEKEKWFDPKSNEIIVRQRIERAKSNGIIFDTRKGLYKRDSIDLDNIKYVMETGQLIIPLKNKQTTVDEKKNQQELLD